MKKIFWIIYWSITITLLITVIVLSYTSDLSEDGGFPFWIIGFLIVGAFPIGRIFSFFEKKPYHHYRNTSGWNPDDHSSGTSGDSSGTSGEGEIFYDEQYDKSDASIYSAYRKPKDKKPK